MPLFPTVRGLGSVLRGCAAHPPFFDGDPQYADIVDGKLYLFVNEEIFEKYKKDSRRILAKAERTWPRIEHKAVGDL